MYEDVVFSLHTLFIFVFVFFLFFIFSHTHTTKRGSNGREFVIVLLFGILRGCEYKLHLHYDEDCSATSNERIEREYRVGWVLIWSEGEGEWSKREREGGPRRVLGVFEEIPFLSSRDTPFPFSFA